MSRLTGLMALTLVAAILCAVQSNAAERCFWLHGRLFAANGNPTFRIWRTGTKRILGVNIADHDAAAIGDLPLNVRALVSSDALQVDVSGDYRVCPLTTDRPGQMRFVRLVQARKLTARPEAARHSPD